MASKHSVGEYVAALGVILSLVFVGVEIRHNTAAVRGATFQAISDVAAYGALEGATSDHLPRLFSILREDPSFHELLPEDRERLRLLYLHTVRRRENIWVQVGEGVVGEDAYDRFVPPPGYFSSRAFRGFWAETHEGLDEDFVAFFEARHPALNED